MGIGGFMNNSAQLVIFERGGTIKTVLFNQQQVTMGRLTPNSTCDIQLPSSIVSSMHGTFTYYNSEYYYTDEINLNGTYLNGVKIPKQPGKPSAAQKLRDGDILTIGVNDVNKDNTVYILFSTSSGKDHVWEAFSLDTIKRDIKIGRDSINCDIHVHHPYVSRQHAIISVDKNLNALITDCKSANGTILNGNLMMSGSTCNFKEFDIVTIGSTKIINLKTAIIYNMPKSASHVDTHENSESQYSIYIEDKEIVDADIIKSRVILSDEYARRGGVELRVEDITKIVPCKKGTGIDGGDKKHILKDVSFTIYPGELVAILGGSGAGKTTLMNAINGFEPATSGMVYFNGNDLYKNYPVYKSQIGYVPQQDIVYDNLTMFDMLVYVAKLRLPSDITKEEITMRVDEVLKAMALEKHRDTLIKKMSGGQRKRASIAVELISDPSLFFLDEPTSGLDPEAETNLMKQLQMLSSKRGKTIIVITHTLQNIHLFDKVIFMAPGGKLCYYGSPNDAKKFFDVENLADAYEKISVDVDGYVNKFQKQRF